MEHPLQRVASVQQRAGTAYPGNPGGCIALLKQLGVGAAWARSARALVCAVDEGIARYRVKPMCWGSTNWPVTLTLGVDAQMLAVCAYLGGC